MKAKNELILLEKVDRFWNKIADQAEEIINKKMSELSLRDRNSESKRKEIIDFLKKNNLIVSTYYNMADVINYLENNERPKSFISSKGEILFSYFINDRMEVDLRHGHLYVMGKYHTIYWINSPVTNEIIIVMLLEEHPKNSRGYSKKELKKRLPKIPDDILYKVSKYKDNEEDSENIAIQKQEFRDYPEKLSFKQLNDLSRVAVNEYRLGAVYVDNKSQFYFFLKLKRQTYVYFKLTNSGLKKLFKYKFDSKTYDENPLKLTLIKDILKSYSKQLFLVNFKDNSEIINSIDYDEVISILRQQGNDEVRFKSVNESIELLMELEDIYLAELMNLIQELDI